MTVQLRFERKDSRDIDFSQTRITKIRAAKIYT